MSEERALRITLIRSAETDWELQGRIRGSSDLPLSSHGVEVLSQALTDPPEIDVIRHATDEASKATARLLARNTGARRRKLIGLEPPNFGLLEGLTMAEATERYPTRSRIWEENPLALNPPDGEPLNVLAERTGIALERTLSRVRTRSIAFVAHPLVIGVMRLLLTDLPSARYHEMEAAAARIEHFPAPDGGMESILIRAAKLGSE
ncbi:MAG: histidine phosphatase family protein [Phycisphaerales bacterium]|nr:histidine phosphatase family protein [Phycisphaerales bacterium]